MANIELVLKLKLVLELELVLLELVLVKLVDFTIEIANPQWQVDIGHVIELVIELQGFNENATNATNNVLQELVNQHAEMAKVLQTLHNVANIDDMLVIELVVELVVELQD